MKNHENMEHFNAYLFLKVESKWMRFYKNPVNRITMANAQNPIQ